MKKLFILSALSLIVIVLIASCGNQTPESKKEGSTTEQAANAKYQCPIKCEGEKMHDKPGQCPKCNMNLQQVEVTHGHGAEHTND